MAALAAREVTDAVTADATVTERATSAVTVAVTVHADRSLEVTDAVTVTGAGHGVTTGHGAHLLIPAPSAGHRTVRRTL